MTQTLELAESLIPEISAEVLTERLHQIREVERGVSRGKNKPRICPSQKSQELFFVESFVDPKNFAFGWDPHRRLVEKAVGLVALHKGSVFSRISGHHSIARLIMEEVLSQVPPEILPLTIAFEVDNGVRPRMYDENHHTFPIIFYGYDKNVLL